MQGTPSAWQGPGPSGMGAAGLSDPAAWIKAFSSLPSMGAVAVTPTSSGGEAAPVRLDPAKVLELQNDYLRDWSALWSAWRSGKQGKVADRRFGADAWTGPHAFLADVYLLNARFLRGLADAVDADAKTRARVGFAVQQWVDAMAPSNFLAFNPDALKKIVETNGESLRTGLSLFVADALKGRILMTDESAFEIGRNVATSPGQVVFENELIQLIQYQPLTDEVFEKPLLIVPPCINKFYILDLQPENSLVRNAVDAGHTTFLVSWRNPTADQAAATWDDYIEDGVIRAMDVVRAITKQKTIDMLGFCIGGTMLTTALAVVAAREKGVDAQPAASLTLLTTLLDFSDTGILDVFVDEASVRQREVTIGGKGADGSDGGPVGLLPARDLATSFSFLRPNDLVWNYVVSSYLKGEAPPPFDLLYWNADSTNLPGPFFTWYLRNTYLENKLMVPNATSVSGVPVDFGKVASPVFIYGSRDDHIVPWPAAYASVRLLTGPKRFVLGASGHIAGVVNPPAKKKRSHWTYTPRGRFPDDADGWFEKATEVPGSWWTEWHGWLAPFAGAKVKAPKNFGNAKYRPIEPAPGRYVTVRAV